MTVSHQLAEKAQAELNAHIAEYGRLYGESHAILQRQQQQINAIVFLSSGLSAAILAGVIQHSDFLTKYHYIFAVIPIPFLLISALHLRDDLKLLSIDEYVWVVLRERVARLSEANIDDLWRWLYFAERLNFGVSLNVFVKLLYLGLSITRYLYSLGIILSALILYPTFGGLGKPFSWALLFYFDILSAFVIFVGGFVTVRRAAQFRQGRTWITH